MSEPLTAEEISAVWNAAYNLIREYDMQTGASGMHHRVEALRAALATPDNAGRNLHTIAGHDNCDPMTCGVRFVTFDVRMSNEQGRSERPRLDHSNRVCNCSPGDGWLHAKTCPKHIGWATPDNAGRSPIEKEAASADAGGSLSFAEFSSTNRARCEAPDGFGHPLSGWTISDWMLAATGEFGEAANVAKKLNRERDGIPGNTKSEAELRADLADEFADAVIYLDLAAQSQGIDLGAAVASKFNRTSAKIGAPHRLSESTGSEGGGS